MDELAAWVLAPLALALLSWGVGLLVERAAATRLEGGLVLPVGMAGSMVLLSLPFGLGLGAPFAFAFVLIFAAAGAFLGRTRLVGSLPELPLALAVLAAFGLYIAPVVMTGEATFAGYTFLGDNSIHFSLMDHVVDHGSRMTGIPGGSFGEVLSRNLDTGYPLGPHFQAAILTWLLGTDVAWLWQGYIAFAVAMAVLPAACLLRPPASAAGERRRGVRGGRAYLPFSYALQGGVKELLIVLWVLLGAVFASEIATGRATVRRAALFGLAAAAGFAVYSTGALPWFLGMGGLAVVAALVWARERTVPMLIGAGASAVVFLVLAAPSIARALTFFSQGKRLLGSSTGADVGNLVAKLPFWEGFGVWLSDDFRFQPSGGNLTLTHVLVGVAAALVVLGGLSALRRRALGIRSSSWRPSSSGRAPGRASTSRRSCSPCSPPRLSSRRWSGAPRSPSAASGSRACSPRSSCSAASSPRTRWSTTASTSRRRAASPRWSRSASATRAAAPRCSTSSRSTGSTSCARPTWTPYSTGTPARRSSSVAPARHTRAGATSTR